MTKPEARAEAVRHWWRQARESLEAARREHAAGAYQFAINRAYYALFYAVTALLLQEDRRFTKHSGVRAAFNKDFVKTRRIEKKHAELYNALFSDREAADYVAFTEFNPSDVQEKINACEDFLAALRALIQITPSRHGRPMTGAIPVHARRRRRARAAGLRFETRFI